MKSISFSKIILFCLIISNISCSTDVETIDEKQDNDYTNFFLFQNSKYEIKTCAILEYYINPGSSVLSIVFYDMEIDLIQTNEGYDVLNPEQYNDICAVSFFNGFYSGSLEDSTYQIKNEFHGSSVGIRFNNENDSFLNEYDIVSGTLKIKQLDDKYEFSFNVLTQIGDSVIGYYNGGVSKFEINN